MAEEIDQLLWPDDVLGAAHRGLTFDVSGDRETAKLALGRPLDGGVGRQCSHRTGWCSRLACQNASTCNSSCSAVKYTKYPTRLRKSRRTPETRVPLYFAPIPGCSASSATDSPKSAPMAPGADKRFSAHQAAALRTCAAARVETLTRRATELAYFGSETSSSSSVTNSPRPISAMALRSSSSCAAVSEKLSSAPRVTTATTAPSARGMPSSTILPLTTVPVATCIELEYYARQRTRMLGPNVRHERRTKGRDAAFGTSARWRG